MQSIEELAYYFVHHITQAKVGVEARIRSALASIPKLLERGWTLQEIKQELDQFAYDYPQLVTNVYHIDEIMSKKEPPNNLIEPDVFYYHNALREVSPPTRIIKDPVTGQFIRQSQPFYLEIKKRFTMQDLLNYWYTQMEITPNEHMIRQDEGKFKYILSNYTLDEVLFAIDAAKTIRKERQLRPLRNAFELDKYIEDAREFIRAKENVHKMQGINREFKRNSTSYYH
jgi:hypothetical protein